VSDDDNGRLLHNYFVVNMRGGKVCRTGTPCETIILYISGSNIAHQDRESQTVLRSSLSRTNHNNGSRFNKAGFYCFFFFFVFCWVLISGLCMVRCTYMIRQLQRPTAATARSPRRGTEANIAEERGTARKQGGAFPFIHILYIKP
jgi:hypothetical protein